MKNINLSKYCNSKGLTNKQNFFHGNLTPAGSSIPNNSGIKSVSSQKSGMNYKLIKGEKDNIECQGQIIKFQQSSACQSIGIIGVGIYGDFTERLIIEDVSGSKNYIEAHFSDFTHNPPYFKENFCIFSSDYLYSSDSNELEIYGCTGSLWEQVILVDTLNISSLKLPDNPCIHIFAISIL
ncbi:hypothetical protein DOK67_0000695 [Enterococcus sp. DIV0212c]|uniref:hypothetical protein n=1 Tax=Enterococcus sp. DIV0212c TaxID=2230867 RepID=UPI001A9AAC27|nr:hypothetical protein [Enterococcus sp. DIV0212c]MBO1354654.1 hypothetical protein [Enterococcus sp. DIV0212c]